MSMKSAYVFCNLQTELPTPGVHCKKLAGRGGATWFGCALGDNGAGLALMSVTAR